MSLHKTTVSINPPYGRYTHHPNTFYRHSCISRTSTNSSGGHRSSTDDGPPHSGCKCNRYAHRCRSSHPRSCSHSSSKHSQGRGHHRHHRRHRPHRTMNTRLCKTNNRACCHYLRKYQSWCNYTDNYNPRSSPGNPGCCRWYHRHRYRSHDSRAGRLSSYVHNYRFVSDAAIPYTYRFSRHIQQPIACRAHTFHYTHPHNYEDHHHTSDRRNPHRWNADGEAYTSDTLQNTPHADTLLSSDAPLSHRSPQGLYQTDCTPNTSTEYLRCACQILPQRFAGGMLPLPPNAPLSKNAPIDLRGYLSPTLENYSHATPTVSA